MIVKEYIRTRKDGVKLYKVYSKAGMKIKKLGTSEVYDEAIDIEGARARYIETNIPVKEGRKND